MAKRTTQTGLPEWEDTSDLEHVVRDKRAAWRGTPAKGRRRNRRYENRILRSQSLEDEFAEADWLEDFPTEEPLEEQPDDDSVNVAEEIDSDSST